MEFLDRGWSEQVPYGGLTGQEKEEKEQPEPRYVCALHGKPHENNAHTNPVTYEVKLLANVVARHAHTLFVICCTSHFLSPIHPPKNHSKKRRSLCLYVVATKRFVPRQKINRRPRETGMITNSTFDGRVLEMDGRLFGIVLPVDFKYAYWFVEPGCEEQIVGLREEATVVKRAAGNRNISGKKELCFIFGVRQAHEYGLFVETKTCVYTQKMHPHNGTIITL